MSLEPYEHYADLGTADANRRWSRRLKWFLIGFIVLGGGIGLAAGKKIEFPLIGAVAGALLGYGIFRLVVYLSASRSADDLYRTDWCGERGMTYLKDFDRPANAPYANSGDKHKTKDAYEGTWNGLDTLFYNFTYTEEGSDSDDPDHDYDYRIMRLTGRDLPIGRLGIHRRSAINRFAWADKLQGAFTKERPVSLESADFNETFDLTIDDQADDIWIRRIFDPATIQGLVDGSVPMPDIRYYDRSWWLVKKGHFKTRELEEWVGVQRTAADAIAVLSRVQEL
jgi:hypothetical protein